MTPTEAILRAAIAGVVVTGAVALAKLLLSVDLDPVACGFVAATGAVVALAGVGDG